MLNLLEYVRYFYRKGRTKSERYINLFKIIFENKCRRILEIGTYDGVHAVQMIQTASIFYPVGEIDYVGFDLFESATYKKLEKEFSKRPPPFSEVQTRLKRTNANVTLCQGDTRITLPRLKDIDIFDFIFIDGGHSIETISADWNSVKELMNDKTVVIFDDYYTNICSQLEGLGCQSIVDDLDKNIYEVQILKPKDIFIKEWGRLEINFAKVTQRRRLTSP